MDSDPTTLGASVAAEWLEHRNRQLGQLLLSERAVPYVSLLAAMLAFRRAHELEPLHEDLHAAARRALGADYDADAFNQDLRQLQEWSLLTARIEKERLRGYKDTRRRKFRYRLADEAAEFLLWLEARRRDDLEPQDADTRDLLSELVGTLRETSRLFHRAGAATLDYETARGVFYRLSRMEALTADASRSLGELNLRLLGFATARYEVAAARGVLGEIERFLKQFLSRIHALRAEILPEIDKLRHTRHTTRWQACRAALEEELKSTAHLMRQRLPQAEPTLAALHEYYAPEGTLEDLCSRVNRSALAVWRKLFTHLRELERRSHRLEDLRARAAEVAALPPDSVPHAFLRALLAPAHLRGDMHFWNETEKALPPQPRWERHRVREDAVVWLGEKPRADGRPPQSLEETRLRALEDWMRARGLVPPVGAAARLSRGDYAAFEDFPRILEVARLGLLGNGARLARVGVAVRPLADPACVEAEGHRLAFAELAVVQIAGRSDMSDPSDLSDLSDRPPETPP